jgi:hypothetical protein
MRLAQPLPTPRILVALMAVAALPVIGVASGAETTAEPIAALQGLDKITARVSRFDAPIGRTVAFGTLSIVVRDCQKSAPEDQPENAAFVEIYENRPGEERLRLFSGWMFSSSPALSALEHPVYDVNLLECKGVAPSPPAPTPTPPAKPPGRSRAKTAR